MLLEQSLSNRVVPALSRVHRSVGPGLLEKVYERAVCFELDYLGLPYVCQKGFPVEYRGRRAGFYLADVVVDDRIVLELKAVKELDGNMTAQISGACEENTRPLLNYLAISGIRVGYVVNFRNEELEIRRFVR